MRGWNRKANFSLREYIFNDISSFLKKYQKNLMREISTLIKLLIPIILSLFFSLFSRELFKERTRLIFLMYPCLYFLMYPMFIIIEKQTLSIVVYLMPDEHERAGIYIKNNVSSEYEKLNIMARKPYINFFSGARFK